MKKTIPRTCMGKGKASNLISAICLLLLLPGYEVLAAGAGILAGGGEKLPPLVLSVMSPLAEKPYMLRSGGYYEIEIICDGSGELGLSGAEFFRNIWIDEVIINDIEIRPMGLHSLEFDDEGTAEISFVAIRPGTYTLSIPGSTGETQRAVFVIE